MNKEQLTQLYMWHALGLPLEFRNTPQNTWLDVGSWSNEEFPEATERQFDHFPTTEIRIKGTTKPLK